MGRMRSGEGGLSCELEEERDSTPSPVSRKHQLAKEGGRFFLYVRDPR